MLEMKKEENFNMQKNIEIKNLSVYFSTENTEVKAVDNITISFEANKITAIVGESGCGKSILGISLFNLLPNSAQKSGSIFYKNINILKASQTELNFLRRREFSLIPQDPSNSLNPIMKIGKQFLNILKLQSDNRNSNMIKMKELLTLFGFKEVETIINSYPFELSGGMQQRILCAMGIAKNPEWIIADEPTKGLDEELRVQVYNNFLNMKKNMENSMLVITHDLSLAKLVADKIAVMFSGEIIEFGENILEKPLHPHTKALIKSMPENGFKPIVEYINCSSEYSNGCKYAKYCEQASKRCFENSPQFYEHENTKVRCFLYDKSCKY